MIALIDDLDQQQVRQKSKKHKSALGRLRRAVGRAVVCLWTKHQKRKADKIALRQLLQLDDALLKDMGLSRYELISIKKGSATFDSLVEQKIIADRDNACRTTALHK